MLVAKRCVKCLDPFQIIEKWFRTNFEIFEDQVGFEPRTPAIRSDYLEQVGEHLYLPVILEKDLGKVKEIVERH